MKVLVTGGSGYIGSHIIEELSKNNYSYINYDLVIGEDIMDKEELGRVFKNNKIDLVIHCAAKLDITESIDNPLKYYSNNVRGTITLLEVMKEHKVDKIIFSSTACVYKDGIAKETDEAIGHNPYAKSKLMCEEIIKDSGIKNVIFRYFNVAGHDKKGVMLIQRIKNKEKITIYGNDYETRDGTCIRDYVHVEDIAKAHIKAIEYLETNKNGLFNLGTNNGYTIKEICDIAKCEYEIGSRRQSDVIISIADNTKAREELGWIPAKRLEDILKEE